MRILRFLAIFFVLALVLTPLAGLGALALEDPAPGAEYVVLVETNSNQVLYEKNANARAYPASLTKIMTVLIACEAIENGEVSASDMITASDNALTDLTEDSSTANIVPGETMSFGDLLYCALVKSANEACNIVGERVSGSISAFVERMNTRARELGCTGTRFANTHGMPDDGHYTTAWDMYLIMSEAQKHPLFVQISGTKSIEIQATNINPPRSLENTNALLADSDAYKGYTYEYAKGGKTGHTSAAGYCLASSATKANIELIAIVMKAEAREKEDGSMNFGHFSDSVLLYNWAFDNFSYQEIIKQTEVIATLPVEMGSDSDTVSVRPEHAISLLLPNDVNTEDAFKRDIRLFNDETGEKLHAPIQSGAQLGEITISRDGVSYGTIPLVATGSVELSKSYYMLTQIKETMNSGVVRGIIVVLAVLMLAYLVIVIRYRVLRIRHRLSVRKARRRRRDNEREGYTANEYYSPQRRGAAKREYINVDNFDEDDYYEDEPIGTFSREDDISHVPDEDEDDNDQSARDYYEEFFK